MPNALPAAHASTNANLFVSAENSQFNNYFAGPQVIQVVVSDPDIQRLDQAYGEPTVTVNGKKLRMAQATDGNWYAYFADRNSAEAADKTAPVAGKGLNFGEFCGVDPAANPGSAAATGVDFSETKGYAVARHIPGSLNGTLGTCSPDIPQEGGIAQEHVVRENKTLNHPNGAVTTGQIGFRDPNVWPVIQLYDFSGFPATVTVDYQKAGGDQISTLTFDRIPQSLISTSVDRTAYPVNSQVFVTINDPQLNIDPTEEDSWTWAANASNNQLFYMAFDRNGVVDADGTLGMQNLIGNLTTLMFDHNGRFTLNPAAQGVNVVDFQANGKEKLVGTQRGQTNAVHTLSIGTNSAPITFIESGGVNTGVFVNWDGAKVANLVTSNTLAIRGESATVRYNDQSTSIVGGFGFATLTETATNGTWASGQKIPITLVDSDANLNSKLTEHRYLYLPNIYQSGTGGIPTMTIGTPFSIANAATNDVVTFVGNLTQTQTAIRGQTTIPAVALGATTAFSAASSANADAVNIEHIALVTPTTGTSPNAPATSGTTQGAVSLGLANSYAILSGNSAGVITNGANPQFIGRGNVGDTGGTTPANSFTFASGYSEVTNPTTLGTTALPGTPIGDAHAVYANIGVWNGVTNTGLACTYTYPNGAVVLSTDTHFQRAGHTGQFGPGVYCIDGGVTITNAVVNTIDINSTGGPVIFKVDGAITMAANGFVKFNGTATSNNMAGNLFFSGASVSICPACGNVGAFSSGANDQFSGTVLTGSTAITTGATGNNTNARFISESAITLGGAASLFSAPPAVASATTGIAQIGATTTTTSGGGIFIDSSKTVTQLLSSIHDDLAADTEHFRGFNFINYDLRSLATNAAGNLGNVGVYLVTNPAGTGIVQANGQLVGNGAGFVLTSIANSTNLQDFINLNGTVALGDSHGSKTTPGVVANGTQNTVNLFHNLPKSASVGLFFKFSGSATLDSSVKPIAADFFSIGIIGDGTTNQQRVNNAVYRWELQETGDNTSTFTGTTEFVMLNQLNIFDPNTYSALRVINHEVYFAAIQDMLGSESRAPQASYNDLGADGQFTIISAQQDVPTHTGVVSFDSKTYKIADTVTITLNDADLNVNNDLVDIYTTVPSPFTTVGAHSIAASGVDPAADTIGKAGLGFYADGVTPFGRLLDIQFGQQDARWSNTGCFGANTATPQGFNLGLADTGFTLVETGASTGIFTGTFEIPDQICDNSNPTPLSVSTAISSVGLNIKVNYVDFLDASGKKVEVSDNAGIRGNTGSITLDKSVYPVPFGSIATSATTLNDFAKPATSVTSLNGVFPLHRDTTGGGLTSSNTLTNGDTIVHIRVNDQDYNISATGTDHIAVGIARGTDTVHGPIWATISRQGSSSLLAFAGGPAVLNGVIKTAPASPTAPTGADAAGARDLGPMTEIDPASGIFQADLPVRFTDGPASNDCPSPTNYEASNGTFIPNQLARFDIAATAGSHYCVRQGDVLTVYYNDTNDASGNSQIVTDSATFDLRNGVLQSDKSVYIIGSDMILTLVEPDLNLDSQQAETAPLDLVEWDSHAFKGTMGPLGLNQANFDAKPSTFVETGKDTGIFQAVIKIPKQLSTTGTSTGTLLERGEQIHLEYTDWGPAGSKTVGSNSQDIELTIYTSNFGATVELDQKVYTWTDRVYITVVAPDHNFDPNLIDTIGSTDLDKVTVSTRGHSISPYKLVETGVDTGIFTGYVILTGDNKLKDTGGVDGEGTQPTAAGPSGVGPTDGFLPAEDSDGVSVSFEFTRDQTVTGSALIRWNIGEIKWLEASYPANGQGVLQIVDPDMNLNPKAVDKFDTNVWSDSDSGGIKLTMTETGEATGIFQGTVYFTTNFQSSGNRLHVAEGDTVTGEYKDRTLPAPYTPADQLRLTSTTFIGTVVPPLERAPASNPRIVDSFGNALTSVKVNQQIQVTADLTNGQDRDQPFAYLVQIQDANGVTVSLSWITGTLTGGQSLNPAQSWTPTASGTYTAQIFVWQSIDNPNALSPPLSTTITVA